MYAQLLCDHQVEHKFTFVTTIEKRSHSHICLLITKYVCDKNYAQMIIVVEFYKC